MIDGKETIPQVAARWNLTPAYVRMLIKQGRIADAVKIGRDWYLPAGAERPKMRPYGTKRKAAAEQVAPE